MKIRSTSFFKSVDILHTDPTRTLDTDSDKGEATEENSASSLDLKCECALSAFVFFFPRFRFFLLGQVIGISGSSGDCSVRVKRACRESSARRSTAGRKLRRHVKRMYRTARNAWTRDSPPPPCAAVSPSRSLVSGLHCTYNQNLPNFYW